MQWLSNQQDIFANIRESHITAQNRARKILILCRLQELNRKNEQDLYHARRSVTSFVMQVLKGKRPQLEVHFNIVQLSMSVSQLLYEEQEAVFGISSHNIRKTTLRKSKTVRPQFIKNENWVMHPCLNLMRWLFCEILYVETTSGQDLEPAELQAVCHLKSDNFHMLSTNSRGKYQISFCKMLRN